MTLKAPLSPNATLVIARFLTSAVACVGCVVSTIYADTVTLRPSVRVADGVSVTLADIATIDGDHATSLATLEIATAHAGAFEVSAEAVRQKLATAGADFTVLKLIGTSTVVRPVRGRAADLAVRESIDATSIKTRKNASDSSRSPAQTRAAKIQASPAEALIDLSQHEGKATPLGLTAALFANAFGSDFASLRIAVRANDLAHLEPKAGMRSEVVAKNAVRSDRVDLEVITTTPDLRIVSRERVRVEPRISRIVLVTRCDARRGASLEEISMRDARYVAPTIADRVADPEIPVDATLARTLPEGTVLSSDDVLREIAIRRNERVLVCREVGMVLVEIEAIALEDGAAGDVIALEHVRPGRRGREAQALSAEVVGRGRAVMRTTARTNSPTTTRTTARATDVAAESIANRS